MRAIRPLIHVFLALLFLVQGVGVAASGHALAKSPSAQAMPCHGPMATQAQQHGKPACCNAACPDMLTCALATLAIPASATMTVSVADHLPSDRSTRPLYPTAPTGAAFRPPISLPA